MKKFINTKKVIVAACILAIVLFVFPLSSFGEEALVCPGEPGQDIQGLVFDFGAIGLPIELPDEDGIPQEFWITCVEVLAQGRENIVLTSSGLYNYDAKLEGEGGIILATDKKVKCKPDGKWRPVLGFEFDSASLNEHFIIEDNEIIDEIMDGGCDTARTFEPGDEIPLDIFFKVKEATLITQGDPIVFDIMLKLNDSELQIFTLK